MSFKTIIFWACFAVVAFPAMAEIEWLSTRYEYGAFKEAEGQRKGSLQFVNKARGHVYKWCEAKLRLHRGNLY